MALYALAIGYASLNPLVGWRVPESMALLAWPRRWDLFDIAFNIAAYVPLGAMLAALQPRLLTPDQQAPFAAIARAAWWRAIIIGAALSCAMELLQAYLPLRVSSPVDVVANVVGCALGAGLVLHPLGRALVARLLLWRTHYFSPQRATEWGLLLIAAWLFAQLNPLIPLFDGRQFTNPFELAAADSPYDLRVLLPQSLGVALNLAGLALFFSLLLHPKRHAGGHFVLFLLAGLVLKLIAAALTLRVGALIEWLAPATVIGMAAGLLMVMPFLRVSKRWRAFWATVLIFAGGLVARVATVYGAVDETLRLLNWPQGHLASFAGLSRWVHDIWPIGACIFAGWLFLKRQSDTMPDSP